MIYTGLITTEKRRLDSTRKAAEIRSLAWIYTGNRLVVLVTIQPHLGCGGGSLY